jgi:hypothetical protein
MKILPHGSRGRQLCVVLALLAAVSFPMAASPLNVTQQTTATLNTNDALFFTLATYSFAVNAAKLGLPTLPSAVSFSFVTNSPGPSGDWDVLLETPDGTVVATFPALMKFVTAEYAIDGNPSVSVGYIGGSISLTSAQSQALFGNAAIVLVLQNLGSTSTVGLSSYSIAHDLTANVFGSGLSTGGVVTKVTLDDPAPPGVPEPRSAWLLVAAALCMAGATFVKHVHR